jgi:hypothetical protein
MIELTEQQRLELTLSDTPRALDPLTGNVYVLVPENVYQHLKDVLGDADPEAMYPLLGEISPEDWEDRSIYGVADK